MSDKLQRAKPVVANRCPARPAAIHNGGHCSIHPAGRDENFAGQFEGSFQLGRDGDSNPHLACPRGNPFHGRPAAATILKALNRNAN